MKSNPIDEEEICRRYVESNDGISKIAEDYHVDKKKIRKCLITHGIEIKKKGKQPLRDVFIVNDWRIEKYPEKDGYEYVAIDRKTGYETLDVNNRGGFLTTHIEKEYGVPTPTLYDRRLYYMRTGNYWWEQWFDIVLREKKSVKKCKYCEWTTEDINNLSGAYLVHLKNVHGISRDEYLKAFPEEKPYFSLVSVTKNRQMSDNEKNYVVCKECGMKLGIISVGHLRTHGMTRVDYIKKYGIQKMVADETHEKLSVLAQIGNENMSFTKSSAPEKEIEEFISNLGYETVIGDRKILCGKEIDLYIPELKIGFEYDGLLYHTEEWGKDKNYHLYKTDKAFEKGVMLYHIFEDEYKWKKDFVLAKIQEIINNKAETLDGSECRVCEINNDMAEEFIENYGIQCQNHCKTISIGAFYKYQLVCVMTFSESEEKTWTLGTIAYDFHYNCCNVIHKLFDYFKLNHEYLEIRTFADRRWTPQDGGNIFNHLGFDFVETTEPDFWYFRKKNNEIKRRDKNEIYELVSSIDKNILSETECEEKASELGYMKIWDCGLIKYVYHSPNAPQPETSKSDAQ